MYAASSSIESLHVIVYNLMNTFETCRYLMAKICKSISRANRDNFVRGFPYRVRNIVETYAVMLLNSTKTSKDIK